LVLAACPVQAKLKQYLHEQAGFKVSIPADWIKVSEDPTGYVFHGSSRQVVVVGMVELDITSEGLVNLTSEQFSELLETSTEQVLQSYCRDTKIANDSTYEQGATTWANLPGYYFKTIGYDDSTSINVAVDIVAAIDEKGSLYMILVQVPVAEYPAIKATLDTMIASFRLIR
jgi:hypothetical protein